MSQPPQSGWGQPPSGDPYGQNSANGGYGAPSPSPGYGQQTYGQDGAFAPAFGDGAGQGPVPQGGEPKKSYKVPILVCAGCAILVLLLLIVGGGIFLFTRDGGETTGGGGGETTATEEQPEEPTDEDEPSEEPSEDPTDEPTAEPSGEPTAEPSEEPSEEPTSEAPEEPAGEGSGTEDDPYALGQQFTLEDGEGGTLDVTVGEVDWDATEEVMAESDLNTEVSENQTYILVPVTVTYHGEATAEPLLLLTLEYRSDAGGTYTDDGALTPQSRVYLDTLEDGDSATWDYGIIVPKDEVKAGKFAVRALFDFAADDTWVRAT